MASVQILSLSAASPDTLPVRGSAAVESSASSSANTVRGCDVSASFQISAGAEVDHKITDAINAAFTAGGSINVGAALQAKLPLDLFAGAGAIARFRLQAEAAAFARATIDLAPDELLDAIKGLLPNAAWHELLTIFLEEVRVRTGVWGRAAFAVQARGEAYCTGSLAPESDEAGFTCRFEYAFGFIYGTGISFLTDLGIPDPEQLCRRLGAAVADLVTRAALAHLDAGAAPATPVERAGIFVLRQLVPLALDMSFRAGLAAVSSDAARSGDVTSATAESLARMARSAIAQAVEAAVADRLRAVIAEVLDEQQVVALEDAVADAAISALTSLRDLLAGTASEDIAAADRWLALVPELSNALAALAGSGILNQPQEDVVVVIATALSATASLRRAAAAGADEAVAVEALDLGPWISARLRDDLELSDDQPITVVRIGEWLVTALGADLTLPASMQRAIDLLVDLFDCDSVGELIEKAFTTNWTDDFQREWLIAAATRLTNLIDDEVVPVFEAWTMAAGGDAAANLGHEVVGPILAALPVVLADAVTADGETAFRRLRETASAVLLVTLRRLVNGSVDALVAAGMGQATQALRIVSGELRNLDEAAGALVPFAGAAHLVEASLLTPDDLADLFDLAAEMAETWNQHYRRETVNGLTSALSLGIANADDARAVLDIIRTSDDPPDAQVLIDLFVKVNEGLWAMSHVVAWKLLLLSAKALWRKVVALAKAVYEGIKLVVRKAREAIAWMADKLEELRKKLEEIVKQIAAIVAAILDDIAAIAERIENLVSSFVSRIRELALDAVRDLVPNSWPGWVEDTFVDLCEAFFSTAETILTAPLRAMRAIANVVEDLLVGHIESLATTEASLFAQISQRVASSGIGTLKIPLRITAFSKTLYEIRIEISAASLVHELTKLVLKDNTVATTIRSAFARARGIPGLSAQQGVLEQTIEDSLKEEAAKVTSARLTPGVTPVITVRRPRLIEDTDHALVNEGDVLLLAVAGINETFLQTTLGVPPRVQIRVNGTLHSYRRNDWHARQAIWYFRATLREDRPSPSFAADGPQKVAVQRAVKGPAVASAARHRGTWKIQDIQQQPRDKALLRPDRVGMSVERVSASGQVLLDDIAPRVYPQRLLSDWLRASPTRGAPSSSGRELRMRPGMNVIEIVVVEGGAGANRVTEQVLILFFQPSARPPIRLVDVAFSERAEGAVVELTSTGGQPIALAGWNLVAGSWSYALKGVLRKRRMIKIKPEDIRSLGRGASERILRLVTSDGVEVTRFVLKPQRRPRAPSGGGNAATTKRSARTLQSKHGAGDGFTANTHAARPDTSDRAGATADNRDLAAKTRTTPPKARRKGGRRDHVALDQHPTGRRPRP